MPLYFFHLSFGDRTVPDDEGVELSNRSAAREEALAVIRDLADSASACHLGLAGRIRSEDVAAEPYSAHRAVSTR